MRLYMDVHVRRAVTLGLRMRWIDVMTAQEDDADRLPDSELLDRAGQQRRVLVSQDDDMLREAHACQREGRPFAGVIYGHQLRVTVGGTIHA